MTIRAFRLEFSCHDKVTEDRVNKTHWGVCYWINKKLKGIAPALRGPKVKGVNVVSVWFADPGTARMVIGSWQRRLNGLEYTFEFDASGLEQHSVRVNLSRLIRMAAEASKGAPYAQLQAIGQLLSEPLGERDLDDIQREIDIPLETRLAPVYAKINRLKKLANQSLERTRGE